MSLHDFLMNLPFHRGHVRPVKVQEQKQDAEPARPLEAATATASVTPTAEQTALPPLSLPRGPLRRGHRGRRERPTRRDALSTTLANGGVFAVDKPAGPTSADIVAQILEAVQGKLGSGAKVGHGGTLDPFATGVLVIGIGLGTRMLQRFLHGGKEYVATVKMGTATNTQDSSGEVLHQAAFDGVQQNSLEEALDGFRGTIRQVPPMFSALKVKGQRLYKLAMEGKEVPREAREVEVHDLELLDFQPPTFTLRVQCGGGLYVRTLGHDLAQAVGTVGHVTSLRRTAVGEFHEADCLSLEEAQVPEKIATRLKRCAVPRPKKRLKHPRSMIKKS